MDLSSLEALGKIGGLAGVAIGRIALLVRPIGDQIPALPLAKRRPLLHRLVVVDAFAIVVLGIVTWLGASLGGHNTIVTGGPCSNTSAGNTSGNSLSCSSAQGGIGPELKERNYRRSQLAIRR